MQNKPLYWFRFTHEGVTGRVDVFPACAYVHWNGHGFASDCAGPALAASILRARLTRTIH